MKYPCDIIKDLLPLYIDDVLSEASRRAVSEHLTECDSCQKYHAAITDDGMLNGDIPITSNEEENTMSESLKKVKLQINKRQRRMVVAAVVSVLIWLGCWHILFNMPLKTVNPADVQVSAAVYSMSEIPYDIFYDIHDDATGTASENDSENDSVTVTMRAYGADSYDVTYSLDIPALPDSNVTVTEDMFNESGFVSVISFTSRYILRDISWNIDDGTIYIDSFKTTLLGNNTGDSNKTITTLEFQQIDKIVLSDGGTETVLWENASE